MFKIVIIYVHDMLDVIVIYAFNYLNSFTHISCITIGYIRYMYIRDGINKCKYAKVYFYKGEKVVVENTPIQLEMTVTISAL